jgi:hypothetical protein
MKTKFRAWDGKTMEYIADLYWFEENGVHEIIDGVANGTHQTFEINWFTGLTDRGNRDVYEGDIVKSYNMEEICTVVWDRNFYATKTHNGATTGLHFADGEFGVEVLGNIHENPEILK